MQIDPRQAREILEAQIAGHAAVACLRDQELAATRDRSPAECLATLPSELLVADPTPSRKTDMARLRAELDRCMGLTRAAPTEVEWA